ncbi:MAG: thioredoxin family protein [Planctomycetota bacterium]
MSHLHRPFPRGFDPSARLGGSWPSRTPVVTACLGLAVGLMVFVGCNPPASPSVSEVEAITPAVFKQTWNDEKIGVLKFGATWCPPCVRTDKEIDALEGELAGDVNFLKIDVDANPQLTAEFEIGPIPHLILVRNGEVIDDQIGGMSKEQIRSWIDSHL